MNDDLKKILIDLKAERWNKWFLLDEQMSAKQGKAWDIECKIENYKEMYFFFLNYRKVSLSSKI